MSYILDALKKSSEERRKLQDESEQQSPLPLGSPVKQRTSGKRPFLMGSLLITILLFSAAGWWLFTITDKNVSSVTDQAAMLPTELKQGSGTETAGVPESAATDYQEQDVTKQSVNLEKQGAAGEKKSAKPINPVTGSNLPLLEELPLSIQAQLPEMKYSGHVFSPNPELRMILINTTVVREGDLINADLRLTEITRDGLIMSHKDTDFKVDLF